MYCSVSAISPLPTPPQKKGNLDVLKITSWALNEERHWLIKTPCLLVLPPFVVQIPAVVLFHHLLEKDIDIVWKEGVGVWWSWTKYHGQKIGVFFSTLRVFTAIAPAGKWTRDLKMWLSVFENVEQFLATVDGQNPAPPRIDYPCIYGVLTIPGGAGFCPLTVSPVGQFVRLKKKATGFIHPKGGETRFGCFRFP